MRERRFSSCCLVVSLAILAVAPGFAQPGLDQLRSEWVGKTVLLRGLYGGDELKFDANGKLIGSAPEESWTIAQVEISKISKKSDRLIVQGKRVALQPDASGKLKPVYRRHQADRDKYETETVKVLVDLQGSDQLEKALKSVFILDAADWLSVVPTYWHSYLNDDMEKQGTPDADGVLRVMEDGTRVYKVGGSVTAPKATYTPDPEYSEAARRAHYTGQGAYLIVVGPDGCVRDLQVKKPAGWGLDENAVTVLKQWVFIPAMNQGTAVAVQLNVDMHWRLY